MAISIGKLKMGELSATEDALLIYVSLRVSVLLIACHDC